jgi:hypothetical protein
MVEEDHLAVVDLVAAVAEDHLAVAAVEDNFLFLF